MTEVTYTFRVERALREAFVAMAEEQDLTAAQILRRLMREAVEEYREAAAHENWTRGEIGAAMDNADSTDALRLSSDAVEKEWNLQKQEIRRRDDE